MVSKNSSIYKASKWIGGSIPSDLPQIISTTTLTDIKYIANTEYIAIYWRGLPALQPLRVDSIRRFNGAPKSVIRDIVEVIKPRRTFDPKKTSDVINEL